MEQDLVTIKSKVVSCNNNNN